MSSVDPLSPNPDPDPDPDPGGPNTKKQPCVLRVCENMSYDLAGAERAREREREAAEALQQVEYDATLVGRRVRVLAASGEWVDGILTTFNKAKRGEQPRARTHGYSSPPLLISMSALLVARSLAFLSRAPRWEGRARYGMRLLSSDEVLDVSLPDESARLLSARLTEHDPSPPLTRDEEKRAHRARAALSEEAARQEIERDSLLLHTSMNTDTGYRCVHAVPLKCGEFAYEVKTDLDGRPSPSPSPQPLPSPQPRPQPQPQPR